MVLGVSWAARTDHAVIGSCGPRDSQYHGLLRSEWRGQQADD